MENSRFKFRAWDTLAELWIKNLSSQEIWFIENPPTYISISQYTGLKDKNGVEIYENDIVQLLGGEEFQGYREYNIIGQIQWQGCGFDVVKDDCGYNISLSRYDTIEIIGNTYENQELLEI